MTITEAQERIDVERLRRGRLKRALEQLKEKNLGAILCFDHGNIRYITGLQIPAWMRLGRHQYAFLAREAEPVIFARDLTFIRYYKETAPWVRVMLASSFARGCFGPLATEAIATKIAEDVKNLMKEYGVEKEPLGVDFETPWEVIRALEKAGIKVTSGEDAMLDARAQKLEEEIDCFRVASAIAEACFDEIRENLRPGVKGNELIGLVAKKVYELGGEIAFTPVLCSGPLTNAPGPCRILAERVIRPGDLVYVDLVGITWMGYHICYYRNFVCGRATPEQKDVWQKCYDLQMDLLKTFRPGISTKEIAEKIPEPEYWGWKEYWETFPNAVCHGIGLSQYDKPWISKLSLKYPMEIKENMVIAVETFFAKKDQKHGVRIEDMIVIRPGGYELLTQYPWELIECT